MASQTVQWLSIAPAVVGESDAIAAIGEIESELHNSAVYREVMDYLDNALEVPAVRVQRLVALLSREAARLALSQQAPASPHPTVPEAPEAEDETPGNPFDARELEALLWLSDAELPAPGAIGRPGAISEPAPPASSPANLSLLLEPDVAPELPEPQSDWEASLQAIGQQIRQARRARGCNLHQLHAMTYVPLKHLRALESGQFDYLPEDVFVCGFVRRIGNALGLDGAALAAAIVPRPKPEVEVMHRHVVRPLHGTTAPQSFPMYASYTALLAGGLGWMALTLPDAIPQTPSAEADRPNLLDPSLLQEADRQGDAPEAPIAPPEVGSGDPFVRPASP